MFDIQIAVAWVFFFLGFAFVLYAVGMLAAYYLLEHRKDLTGRVTASLDSIRTKKDVPIYEHRSPRSPGRIVMVIQNWSKSVYKYTVNDQTYKIRYAEAVKQMPYVISVVYLKRLPKIACVKSEGAFDPYGINALIGGSLAVLFFLAGMSIVFQ